MTEDENIRLDFYVYAYYRDGVPVYIGKGSGRRWKRPPSATSHNPRLRRMILKDEREGTRRISRNKVADGLTEAEAFTLEIELIAKYGRSPNGPLVNMTDGGQGQSNPSAETRLAISRANSGHKRLVGFKHTVSFRQMRQRLARGNKSSLNSPRSGEVAAKISLAKRGASLSGKHKAKIGAASKGRTLSLEARAKVAAAQTGNKSRTGLKHLPETIEKIRASALRRHAAERLAARLCDEWQGR